MISYKLFSLVLISAVGLYGCTDQPANSQATTAIDTLNTATAEALGSGDVQNKAAANFASYCSGCHGDNATTFADRKWKWGDTPEAIYASIKEGHPDAGMPAFAQTFSEAEIKGLVSYIQHGIAEVARYTVDETVRLPDTIKTDKLTLRLETIASDFGDVPWAMAFLPDGGMLITEIGGTLYKLPAAGDKLQKVSGAPKVQAEGQGGLLDVTLHPDFKNNQLVYLSYSAVKQEKGETLTTTAITQARLEGNALKEQKVIFEAQPWSTTRHHYGSRLAFGKDGLLYVSVGDRGNHDENPQDLKRGPGKIHRLKDDGSIPSDNPFTKQDGAQASIFSYGHRNPQGMAFHPETGVLWENEHGPRGGDEINVVRKGANYGWPAISYGLNYDGTILTNETKRPSMEQPLQQWTPSIAPSGMAFVTGNNYPGWEGNLLTGSLRFKYLNRTVVEGTKVTGEEQLLKNIGRLRDVKMSPDGFIYIAVEDPARIYRLVPVPGQ